MSTTHNDLILEPHQTVGSIASDDFFFDLEEETEMENEEGRTGGVNQKREDLVDGDDSVFPDELDDEFQEKQKELIELRQREELLERQKQQLEDLRRKQHELHSGKSEMTEKLTRALVIIERQAYESQKRVEQLLYTKEAFNHHLAMIEAIEPEHWIRDDLHRELSAALGALDDARDEYGKSTAALNATREQAAAPSGAGQTPGHLQPSIDTTALDANEPDDRDFVYWLKCGFAFTLPVTAVALIALLVFIFSR